MRRTAIITTLLLYISIMASAQPLLEIDNCHRSEYEIVYYAAGSVDLSSEILKNKISKPMTNREILEKANQAFSKGNYEEFLSYCTEDTRWTYVGDRVLEGKDKVREYLAAAYEESTFKIESYIEQGEYLVALGWIKLKDEEGKMIRYSVCDVWKFRDGKMAELNAFVIKE